MVLAAGAPLPLLSLSPTSEDAQLVLVTGVLLPLLSLSPTSEDAPLVPMSSLILKLTYLILERATTVSLFMVR